MLWSLFWMGGLQREKISSHPPLKKLKSLNDLDQAHDEQEVAFLKLQVLEQQSIIDDLTRVNIFSLLSIFSVFILSFTYKSQQYTAHSTVEKQLCNTGQTLQ